MKFIYRVHANVEFRLRWSGWSYREKFDLSKHGNIILNSMNQTREKWYSLVVSYKLFIFKQNEDAMIFCVFIFIFCLETTVREQLDENDFHHYYGNFFESTILKLLDHSFVHFTDMLILSWVNIFKRKSTKVHWKLSFTQKFESALRRTLLHIVCFFFA